MDYYRPCNPENRAARYTCPVCKEEQPGRYFIRMSEPHPDIVRKFEYDPKTYRRKKIIDLRACRFCYTRQYQREYQAKLKERVLADTRAAFGEAVLKGMQMRAEQLPPEARPQRIPGDDPVLLYCRTVLKDSKRRRGEVLRKAEAVLARRERVANVGTSDDPALTFLKYQYKLYSARIDTALSIRERRRRDLQNPMTATDPVRLDWSAYVTPEEKAKVVRAARRANQHRVAISIGDDNPKHARVGARPFTWMPNLTFVPTSDEAARRKIVRMAWSDHIARAKNTEAKAVKFIRHALNADPLQERARRFMPAEGTTFTMVEFYRALLAATTLALDRIEQAIGMEMMPTSCTLEGIDVEVIKNWEQLVPLHAAEIRRMRTGLDAITAGRLDPFSRLFVPRVLRSLHTDDPQVREEESKRRRNRKQISNGLDWNGLPLPIPAPALEH